MLDFSALGMNTAVGSKVHKKSILLQPPALSLGGEKVFFDISEISHNASNFLYINKSTAQALAGFVR